ncbi:hypothetical protein C0995_005568 [Termitomyces sp. Mi166|nr:hypothetical protein C0995_005568 [Termitomyces sp. Mi166\
MSRQDKATTERFTRILRELVKRPENKIPDGLLGTCIHRGMGTHISKVKSVDLDTWTPEQMESIQKWGNHLANLYWEAHLKPGHIPPEHKMESFIRSKYESRRWALEGPPPSNPSNLQNSHRTCAPQPQQEQPPLSASQSPRSSTASVSTRPSATTTRQPQAHPLLSASFSTNSSQRGSTIPSASAPAPVPAQPKVPENDLFSLDFHAPTSPVPSVSDAPRKNVKQDIFSLFSSPSPVPAPTASTFGQLGTTPATSPWVTQAAIPQQQQQPVTSMLGTSGVGAWGVSSGWGAPAAAPPAQNNLWGASQTGLVSQQQQSGLFNTSAVWGSSPPAVPIASAQDSFGLFTSSSSPTASAAGSVQPKKDDVFGDLWGGFK